MITKQIIMKKLEINYYRNKMITEIEEILTIKNYIDPMLN